MALTDRPWRCKSRIMTSSPSLITASSLPPAEGPSVIRCGRPAIPGMPGMAGSHENWGNFKCHKWGELLRHSQIEFGLPLNRQTWIDVNWGSEVPKPWTAEDE